MSPRNIVLVGVLLCAYHATATYAQDDALPDPGSILSESRENIANGYVEVNRSQVNGPGSFEGVGHFSFIYYKNKQLCQCRRADVAISPRGEFAIYVNSDNGKLTLFRASSGLRKELSQEFVGYPKTAIWDLKNKKVTVKLEQYVDGAPRTHEVKVML